MQIRDYLIIYTLIFNHSQNRNLKTQSKVQNSCFILFLQMDSTYWKKYGSKIAQIWPSAWSISAVVSCLKCFILHKPPNVCIWPHTCTQCSRPECSRHHSAGSRLQDVPLLPSPLSASDPHATVIACFTHTHQSTASHHFINNLILLQNNAFYKYLEYACNYKYNVVCLRGTMQMKNAEHGCQVTQTWCICGFEGTYSWGFQKGNFHIWLR